MKIEISDESLEKAIVEDLTQHIKYHKRDLKNKSSNCYVWGDNKADNKEIKRHIKAFKRVRAYYGG